MCGIIGVINYNDLNFREILNSLYHRGPEYQGSYFSNNIWLGHARLSIIDLSDNSNQPICSDENFVLVYNGEIYNYKELGLLFFGKKYSSDSLFLYDLIVKYSEDMNKFIEIIKSFRGMWAFAFLNKKNNVLYLFRDFFGKKPLYYYHEKDKFVFSSEIKTIKKILKKRLYLNEIVLQEVLKYRFSYLESPFIEINMLRPGSYAIYNIKESKVIENKYFDTFDLIKDENPYSINSDNIERIGNSLYNAVKYRMVSDAKIGSITSGGIDSSLISAMACKINNEIELFHVNVRDNSETVYARILKKYLKTKMHIYIFTTIEMINNYKKALYFYEYPMVHPNNVALLGLSKLANSLNTKVLLSGEGADELFGGYSNASLLYRFMNFFRFFLMKRKDISFLFSEIFNFDFKKFLLISPKEDNFLPIELEMEKTFEKYYKYYSNFYNKKLSIYSSFLAVQFEYYTKPLLLRGDKMFMAHSVELRNPFFDIEVVKNAMLTHPKLRKGKKILKLIAEMYIPKEIIHRKKMGFSIPSYKNLIDKKIYKNEELNFIYDSFYKLGEVI